MPKPAYLPAAPNRILVVESMDAFLNAPFSEDVNCILYPRALTGAFNTLARELRQESQTFYAAGLENFAEAHPAYGSEIGLILADIDACGHAGFQAYLRVVDSRHHYKDIVHGFHVDFAQAGKGRAMCCYTGPVTEAVRNEDATQDGLNNRYVPKPGAVFQFQVGDLWRQAGTMNGGNVLPFIHRAPRIAPEAVPRLVLVGI